MEKIITPGPPSEFCCYSLSTHSHFLGMRRASERGREPRVHPPSLCMCVYFLFFSISHQSAAAPSLGAVHIFYFALDGLISLSSSRRLFMVPYIYIPAALQLLFSALCPPRKYGRGVGKKAGEPAWICKEIIEVFNDFPPRLQTANFGVQFHHSDLFCQRIKIQFSGGIGFFVTIRAKLLKRVIWSRSKSLL